MGGKARRCLVTGETRPPAEMIRFVVGPDGELVPDVAEKLPGRGYWVTAEGAVFDKALHKGRLAKAVSRQAGTPVRVPADLRARTAAALRARILSLLGLARRTGEALAGFDVIARAAETGADIALLAEAGDGAADGKRKLRAKIPAAAVAECFDKAALSGALGRENVTHIGLKRSRLAEKIQLEVTRLAGLEDWETTASVDTDR